MGKANFIEDFRRDAVVQFAERGYLVAEVSERLSVRQQSRCLEAEVCAAHGRMIGRRRRSIARSAGKFSRTERAHGPAYLLARLFRHRRNMVQGVLAIYPNILDLRER